MRLWVAVFLFAGLTVAPVLQGCNSRSTPCVQSQENSTQKLASLKREKDDTLYEIKLRQSELNQMIAKHISPRDYGGIRFTPDTGPNSGDWLERKTQLTEQTIQLQVKVHDLDLQIAALQYSGARHAKKNDRA